MSIRNFLEHSDILRLQPVSRLAGNVTPQYRTEHVRVFPIFDINEMERNDFWLNVKRI